MDDSSASLKRPLLAGSPTHCLLCPATVALSPRGGPCGSGSFWPEGVSLVSGVYGFPVERCLSSLERAVQLQCRFLHLTDREREWQCSPWKEVVQLILRVLGSSPKHAVRNQLVSVPFCVGRGALSFNSHYSSTLNCLNWDKIVLSLRLLLWVYKLLITEALSFVCCPAPPSASLEQTPVSCPGCMWVADSGWSSAFVAVALASHRTRVKGIAMCSSHTMECKLGGILRTSAPSNASV